MLVFTLATLLNVILSTIRSLCTVKCNKWVSALANAVCYGFYCYVIILTVSDLLLWLKIAVTAITNFLGVWLVKWIEEKAKKDKLWLVKLTVPCEYSEKTKCHLELAGIPFSYIDIKKYYVFDTYCATQKQTLEVEWICKQVNGKMFATEDKL